MHTLDHRAARRPPRRRRGLRGLALLALGLAGLVTAACGDNASPPAGRNTPAPPTPTATPEPEPAEPVRITDASGHELVFEASPQRIISHSPGATEMLFAIGAGDRVIAADEFSDYPPETANVERVAYSDPDPERALALEPDLVIFAGRQGEQLEQFRGLDLPVLFLAEPPGVAGVLENILLLGRVTGQDAEAQALVADMRERIEAITAGVEDIEEGPRVFWELTDDLYTVRDDTFIGSMLLLLKAQNIAAGTASPFPQLTSEAVIEANPEVILLANAEWGVSLETVRERPGWDAIAAVQDERVYPVDPDRSSRPGPRIVEAMEEIAALLYPDRFE